MKRLSNPVIPKKEGERKLVLEPCCECGKPVDAYYGRYGEGGVCSKACDILHMKKKEGEK